jgi:hypothetical protein
MIRVTRLTVLSDVTLRHILLFVAFGTVYQCAKTLMDIKMPFSMVQTVRVKLSFAITIIGAILHGVACASSTVIRVVRRGEQ